jgi:hypothetical protein
VKYLVSFGGGVTSYEALRRTIVTHGKENTVAVFADVGTVKDAQGRNVCGEDDDLHRFMAEVETLLDFKITRIKHPTFTDIWNVFFSVRMMGNSRVDPCSAEMKRGVLDDFRDSNFMPLNTVLVVGLDWTEQHRVDDFSNAVQPWRCWFPLCEEPRVTKARIVDCLRVEGIEPPQLYEQGFSHNNCGGFCVKMGHEQAFRLWRQRPHVYAFHEAKEQEFRAFVGKDVSILRDRRKEASSTVLTLAALRSRFESGYKPTRRPGEGCGGSCVIPQPKIAA